MGSCSPAKHDGFVADVKTNEVFFPTFFFFVVSFLTLRVSQNNIIAEHDLIQRNTVGSENSTQPTPVNVSSDQVSEEKGKLQPIPRPTYIMSPSMPVRCKCGNARS